MKYPSHNLEAPDKSAPLKIPEIFFFDVPVYRLEEEEYYRNREKTIERVLYPNDCPLRDELRSIEDADPKSKLNLSGLLEYSYGGAWLYNEIIGYIRLHFLGTQIRGEYYAVDRQRIVRTRKKILVFRTWKLAPEREIPNSAPSDEIYSIVLQYIDDCRKELKRRYIDSSGLERIGPYVNWKALYEAS